MKQQSSANGKRETAKLGKREMAKLGKWQNGYAEWGMDQQSLNSAPCQLLNKTVILSEAKDLRATANGDNSPHQFSMPEHSAKCFQAHYAEVMNFSCSQ